MNGAVSALALAAAFLIVPSRPRCRLTAVGLAVPLRRRFARSPLPWMLAGAAVATAILPPAVVGAAAVAVGTYLLRRRRQVRRQNAEQESRALETALDMLAGELRVGAHPVAAFRAAAAELDGPVGVSFRAVAARAMLGADVPGGLRNAAASSALPGQWERLAVCWDLAQQHGLTMTLLIRAAQRDIGERTRFRAGVTAGMAGARATAAVLTALPLVGIALGQAIGAEPVRYLLSGGGGWLLLTGVVLACCGLLWSDRIAGAVVS